MKENMAIVTARKEVIKGKRMWMITGLHKFKKLEELPEEYTREKPMMYAYSTDSIIMWIPDKIEYKRTTKKVVVGEICEQREFEEIINWMRVCGNRLDKINERLKEENKNWKGEEVFEI